MADKAEAKREYGIDLVSKAELKDFDAVLVAVDHDDFKEYSVEDIKAMYSDKNENKILFDVKGIYNKDEFEKAGFNYWRL